MKHIINGKHFSYISMMVVKALIFFQLKSSWSCEKRDWISRSPVSEWGVVKTWTNSPVKTVDSALLYSISYSPPSPFILRFHSSLVLFSSFFDFLAGVESALCQRGDSM